MAKRDVFKGFRKGLELGSGFKASLKPFNSQAYSWERSTEFKTEIIQIGMFQKYGYTMISDVFTQYINFNAFNQILAPHQELLSRYEQMLGGVTIRRDSQSVFDYWFKNDIAKKLVSKENFRRVIDENLTEFHGEEAAELYKPLLNEQFMSFFNRFNDLNDVYQYLENEVEYKFYRSMGIKDGYLIRILLRAFLKAPDFEEMIEYAKAFWQDRIENPVGIIIPNLEKKRIILIESILPELMKIYQSDTDLKLPEKYYHFKENYREIPSHD